MAYAAVSSLDQILEQMSNPRLEQHQTPLQDQQIKSLQENLKFLLDFLDDSWQRRSVEPRCLEREIRDAAYKIEDIMESHITKNFFGQESFHERRIRDQTFCENFVILADEIDSKAAKLKKLWGATDLHQSQRTSLPTGQSRLPSSRNNAMVGFHNDLIQIMDRLTGHQATLQLIPLIGMGGIGKTTLARNVYDNPSIEHHFHTRAWAAISQEYSEREVVLRLLDSMELPSAEMRQVTSTEDLKLYLHQSLKGRRYLVVLDDVWTTEDLDSLRRIFPDDGVGSRIMLTTRLSSVVDFHHSPHHMRFLDETESWNLLRQTVFGEDSCPHELEEAGKKIARNCKGLPLSLVVTGGHLSKAADMRSMDRSEDVAENVKFVTAEDASCSEILSLSYDHLPHHLKTCFLYMGAFPEHYEISVSKLIKLWVAEGFVERVRGKTLEEVAEEYLEDLISRNLIFIRKKSSSGKIKSCSIHYMLRDLCLRKALEEKVFHVTETDFNVFHKELSSSDNPNVNPSMRSFPPLSSILGSGSAREIYESDDEERFPLHRVLDLAERKVNGFPIGEMKSVHLRYIAFSCDGKISIPKTLPDFVWNLQTLIVDCKEVHLPEEIWRMPQLRHLLFGGVCFLPCPSRSQIDGENLALPNLLTLSKVSSSSCTKEIFERVPNLKKLGILIEYLKPTPFSLGNLVNLHQLETLKIKSEYECLNIPMSFTFPPNIKKLTLEGCRIPWKHMTIVGSMPNLEVLKLQCNAFDGTEWEPTEGEFCELKFLLLREIDLEHWKADDTHFPRLEHLILRQCFKLKEIPCSIGYIQRLEIIDLDDASPSTVTSAEQIEKEQKNWGNDSLQVHVHYIVENICRVRKEAEAEIIVRSNDDTLLLKATKQFHSLLLHDPIKEVIPGVVPRLFEFLDRDDYPLLQCEAALAITSISKCSSDNINMLIDQGAVPILVRLLSSPKDVLREQALEVLGYFARDSTKSRDLVLSDRMLMPLLEQFNDKTKLSIMRKATRTLSNLCQGKPRPQFDQVKSALLPLAHLILTDDKKVLKYACSALLNLTDGTKDIIQAVIDAGVFPRLFELLLYPSPVVSIPALCTVDNIISYGDDVDIQEQFQGDHLLDHFNNHSTD